MYRDREKEKQRQQTGQNTYKTVEMLIIFNIWTGLEPSPLCIRYMYACVVYMCIYISMLSVVCAWCVYILCTYMGMCLLSISMLSACYVVCCEFIGCLWFVTYVVFVFVELYTFCMYLLNVCARSKFALNLHMSRFSVVRANGLYLLWLFAYVVYIFAVVFVSIVRVSLRILLVYVVHVFDVCVYTSKLSVVCAWFMRIYIFMSTHMHQCTTHTDAVCVCVRVHVCNYALHM